MYIPELIKRSAKWNSERVAIVFEGREVTYREFMDRATRIANGLRGLGLVKGDTVAVLMGNYPAMAESQFALALGGFVYVRLNPRLSPKEYATILNDSEAKAVLVGGDFESTVRQIQPDLKSAKNIILEGSKDGTWIDYENLIRSSSSEQLKLEATGNDYYSIRYSSGTTGRPKGILHTEKSRKASLLNAFIDTPMSANDVMLHVSPLSHGSSLYLFECFVVGGRNIIARSFDARKIFETIEREKVTVTYVVPTMISILLESKDVGKWDLSSLKCVIYAGSPMAPSKLKEAIDRFGSIFHQVYGMGEVPNVVASLKREEHSQVIKGWTSGSSMPAGRPSLLCDVKIVDENFHEVKLGEIGEIIVKSEQMLEKYWKLPDETKRKMHGDWLCSGDLGRMDASGYLYVVERKDDLIISGGFNIYPTEVENVLCRHPKVLEASVIGVPHAKWGEAVKAVVVLKSGAVATADEIIDFCKSEIADFKRPKSVEFLEALPKNATGKILKKELRARYRK
jgi:long-chain acyl-CoA synthetase